MLGPILYREVEQLFHPKQHIETGPKKNMLIKMCITLVFVKRNKMNRFKKNTS